MLFRGLKVVAVALVLSVGAMALHPQDASAVAPNFLFYEHGTDGLGGRLGVKSVDNTEWWITPGPGFSRPETDRSVIRYVRAGGGYCVKERWFRATSTSRTSNVYEYLTTFKYGEGKRSQWYQTQSYGWRNTTNLSYKSVFTIYAC